MNSRRNSAVAVHLRGSRRWLAWLLDKLILWLLMYAITLSLFLYETGSLRKAATFGLIAASIKACAAAGHHRISRRILGKE